ncbi:MAG: DUF2269 family protein [Actinobacteria bacterium]|nr:DUF2269 family protein [Actinomycetota bacterium]
MTWYETFLWLHISATALWVGGDAMIQAFAYRILRSRDAERIAGFSRDVEWIGLRVLMPSSLVLILSAVALMINGNWDWSEPFVSVGLAVWIVSFLVGAGFLVPESGRIAKVIDEQGAGSPDAQRRIRRILLYSRLELVLLLVVVFMMVVKLGT